MALFISYSHEDKEFAERLAGNLMLRKVPVWVDSWELNVGDSLISRIQDAIHGASALLVVLSKASVQSEWCKKEMSAGLVRELEEKRVVVLPVLLEDCEVPLFLREKLYADFRKDFDAGFKAILDAVAKVTSANLGRIEQPEFHTDWSVSSGVVDDLFGIEITMVDHSAKLPFSCLTQLRIVAKPEASARYRKYKESGLGWWGERRVMQFLIDHLSQNDMRLVLEDERPKEERLKFVDPRHGDVLDLLVVARRLGEDTGKDILIDCGERLRMILSNSEEMTRTPTDDEIKKIQALLPRS